MSYTQAAETAAHDARPHDAEQRDRRIMGMDGELSDLYAAVLVVVPLAFFLRWLCP